ncbi:MAG: anthranilate phosphoribosyltransferase [Candidatus Omnitrophota bacterium]
MIQDAINKVSKRIDLSQDEMETAMSYIAEGQASDEEISSFLVALAKKKETAEEIAGAARAMRKYMSRINIKKDIIFDTCGTGGDQKGTFNISTITALVVAGAGVTVAKHGNRGVSSPCGSADLLEAMGVNIDASVGVIEKCINEIGIGFLFAPLLHPAMQYVQPVRKNLKMRTIFNIMGPLINPAFPTHQLVGVYDQSLVPILGRSLMDLGTKHAMVVWGEGGFDEVTTTGKTFVCEVREGHIKEYVLEPEKFDLVKVDLRDLLGGDVDANKQIALKVLKGIEGPERDAVVFNAGCCLYIAGRAFTIKEGMGLASDAIDSGAPIKKLNKLIEYTNP